MSIDALISQILNNDVISISSLAVAECPFSDTELALKREIECEFGEFVSIEDLELKFDNEFCEGNQKRIEVMGELVDCARRRIAKDELEMHGDSDYSSGRPDLFQDFSW